MSTITLPVQNKTSSLFNEQTVYDLINSLSSIVDIKKKDVFLNFVIVKQIDLMLNTITINEVNKKYMDSIV